MMKPAIALSVILALGLPLAAAQPAWKPDRNVEIVVPSAPGGSNDKTARTVERMIQEKRLLGTTFTVVNKPGGGNNLMMSYIAQHPADAHFLMVGTPTILTNHIVGSSQFNYTDFTPIASLFNDYVVFAVKADTGPKTGRELAERMKKDPKGISIGFATTVGSHNHIAAGLLAKAVGIDPRTLKAIAFKGSAEAIIALLGGHIDLVTTAAGNVSEHVATGKLRVVSVAANQRMGGVLAGVPTWKEQGINVVFGAWRSIMGPRGMTPPQIAFWEKIFSQVVAAPEWKVDLERNYWSDDFALSGQFRNDLKQEYADMKTVLTDIGLAKN
jgi:putative tricarboxylic transport membrane protein